MQIALLGCLFGAVWAMGLWAAGSVRATIGRRRTSLKSLRPASMPIARLTFLAAMLLAAAPRDVAAAAPTCHGALRPQQVAQLLFGRDIGGRLGVSEAAWRRFVAREVTPRFPNGLTVIDASGEWRVRRRGATLREPSKLIEIVLPGRSDDQNRLDAIVAAYKRQFRQVSVGVIVQSACVAF